MQRSDNQIGPLLLKTLPTGLADCCTKRTKQVHHYCYNLIITNCGADPMIINNISPGLFDE